MNISRADGAGTRQGGQVGAIMHLPCGSARHRDAVLRRSISWSCWTGDFPGRAVFRPRQRGWEQGVATAPLSVAIVVSFPPAPETTKTPSNSHVKFINLHLNRLHFTCTCLSSRHLAYDFIRQIKRINHSQRSSIFSSLV